jgi:alpha-glucuronidase
MHHVAWTKQVGQLGGLRLIDYLYQSHGNGVAQVAGFGGAWAALEGRPGMDDARHATVAKMLAGQLKDAEGWCRAMTTFFHEKSGIAPPGGLCGGAPTPPPAPALPTPPPPPTPATPPASFTKTKGA